MCSPVKAQRKVKICYYSLFGILTLAIMVLGAPAAQAAVNKSRIYYGDPYNFKMPGEIKAHKVFNTISEFKQIEEGKIKSSDAEYWILMRRANKKFRLALKRVSSRFGYDLIGEIGCIRTEAKVPDITPVVIVEINKMQK